MDSAVLAPEAGPVFDTSNTDFSAFAKGVYLDKYAMKFNRDGDTVSSIDQAAYVEDWADTARRVTTHVLGELGYSQEDPEWVETYEMIRTRRFLPGGRYLYASGRQLHQTQNCLLLKCEDSREGWADTIHNATMALMTGAGIGIDWSALRPAGALIQKTGGFSSGPLAPMRIINELGRNVMQGGHRRSAIWAGLNWKHKDIFKFIDAKNWAPEIRAAKAKDFNHPADLDMTNISVLLDDEFFEQFEAGDPWATKVYWSTVKRMLKTAEPGFSIDTGENTGETLRNACTEVTSRDDSDICNLGSLNLARINSLDEFQKCLKHAVLFLLAGTVYSDVPYQQVSDVREKNRRLGLGIMGIHEWLLVRGKKYGPDAELQQWLESYSESTDTARYWAGVHSLSVPVKTRAIAPTGTIGIVAETTTGIEPIFCAAYKRRVRTADVDGGDKVRYEYVVDPTARRLIDQGVDPSTIEDAYTLAMDPERRIAFQAWVQQYVDHSISSTINLPEPIVAPEEVKEFGETLFPYLPRLRGMTVYPDGARAGQPISPVDLEFALSQEGIVFEEEQDRCVGGACGS
jgi:ribonucleoside-diphosphate reductase alpha chain